MLEVINTDDGSTTIFNKELNATYHSKFGAVQESTHIFINNGLRFAANFFGPNLNVMEIGFGTGLNAFLTLQQATLKKARIHYFTIEKYPVPENLFSQLNYPEFITQIERNYFYDLHHCKWNEPVNINPYFTLTKYKGDVKEMELTEKAHVIYYDAFGPGVAPEMWQPHIFEKLYNVLLKKGNLITFCAQGEVKRVLKRCGFNVEPLQGPPGKREITRAIKN